MAAAGLAMLATAAPAVRRILRDAPPGGPSVDDPRALADPDSEFIEVCGLSLHVKRAGAYGADLPGRRSCGWPGGQGRAGAPAGRGHSAPLGAATWICGKCLHLAARHGTTGESGVSSVAFDRPAFGLTSRPRCHEWDPRDWPGGSPYGPEAQAYLTIALLDHLELHRVVLVGNSMGGALAALTALRYPERVEALVLEDAAMFTGGASGVVAPSGEQQVLGRPRSTTRPVGYPLPRSGVLASPL